MASDRIGRSHLTELVQARYYADNNSLRLISVNRLLHYWQDLPGIMRNGYEKVLTKYIIEISPVKLYLIENSF